MTKTTFNHYTLPLYWTPEEIGILKQLWADKTIRLSEIARRLGKTNNAVIGKAHRLKLQERRQAAKPKTVFKAKVGTLDKTKYKRPVVTEVTLTPRYVNYNELEKGMCQFPLSHGPFEKPYGWCGEPCHGIYCKEHRKEIRS